MITQKQRPPYAKKGQTRGPLLENILIDVARHFKKPVARIKEKDTHAELVICRRLYCYVAFKITNATLVEIGNVIGQHHSSVIHLKDTASFWIKNGNHEFIDDWFDYLKNTELWGAYEKIR